MVTLDACFEAGLFPQPQLLKLDVQGYEPGGARGRVSGRRPVAKRSSQR